MTIPHTLFVKLGLAIVLGGAIGIERELRSKSAGFRTSTLVCLGATLFTIFSIYIGSPISQDRIASNVVVGIGFLGAGVIFRSNHGVHGITTAASMWLSAALGVGLGCGYFSASILGCLLVITILFVFSFVDVRLDRINQVRTYRIVFPFDDNQGKFEKLIKDYNLRIKRRAQSKQGNIITGEWIVAGSEKDHLAFIDLVLRDHTVTEFAF